MILKKGQFNFVWIFAILAGGTILVLAIYGAVKTGDTYRYQSDTEVAKSISVVTDPLQAGFAEGSFGKIKFKQETRINNLCVDSEFGKNDISVSTRSDIGKPWNLAGGAISIHNKYIFSNEKNSGIDYYVFSKPFNFPYDVADLIFLTSENYCFVNAPKKIADEVLGLNIENIKVGNCTLDNAVDVCFGSGNCDIIVHGSCGSQCDSLYDTGTVSKFGNDIDYVGNLMWAAIFSNKYIYDCNIKRLMYRNGKIAEMLTAKTDLMNARGCNTNLKSDLIIWSGTVINATSKDLKILSSMSDNLRNKNDRELCGVW